MKNIVIVGHYFAITAALGYLVDAAKRNKDLNVITAGSYHGVNMPYGSVNIVSQEYDNKPDYPFPPMDIGTSFLPVEMLEDRLEVTPDLWLTVDAGFRLLGKPSKGINTVFYTDPHTGLRGIYNSVKSQYDYIFNPQYSYFEGGETYLPYAADPVYHAPMDGVEKIYDVCIIGNYYEQRVKLIERLKADGINCFFQLGLAKDDARLIMNQSKICINWSSLDDLTARVFETLSTGNILLANRVSDLGKHFTEDKEYFGFTDENEAVNKVKYILSNYETTKLVGDAGRKAIINRHHFWDDRINTILETSKLW